MKRLLLLALCAWLLSADISQSAQINGSGSSGSGAPTDATYITQTANGTLSAEQALGSLATGCMASATTTGVVATRTITGTANEVTVTNGDCSAAPTISITTNPTLPGNVTVTGTLTVGSGAGPAVFDMLEGTAPGANGTASHHNVYINSTGSVLESQENGEAAPKTYLYSGGALGTPASGSIATNLTGLPVSTGISGLGTGVATALATPSSANLAAALTDETGSGGAVFGTAPTISSAVLSTKVNLPRVTAFPGTPSAGDTVIVTDDSTAGACDSAAGAVTSLCQFDGASWVKLGDGTAAGGALSSADIDTSVELRTIVTDESGTGALLFAGGNIAAGSATTAAANDNTTLISTTAYVQTELTAYASDTVTLTNKTLDAEGTGNLLTIPVKRVYAMAGCNNATAGPVWDLPTATPATAVCVTGTNIQKGALQFADTTGGFSAQMSDVLPVDFTTTGGVDVNLYWTTPATTGNGKWTIQLVCTDVAATATDDPAFPTTGNGFITITTAANAAASRVLTSAALANTVPASCVTSTKAIAHWRLFRDGNDAADTLTNTTNALFMEVTYRRAM